MRFTKHLVVIVLCASLPSVAIGQSAAELKNEIRERCERQMGQYGRSLVLACMNQDREALTKLVKYQKSHSGITQRCLSQMREYGFSLVASCIEQDIEAQREIEHW